jgi:hypothetical protein
MKKMPKCVGQRPSLRERKLKGEKSYTYDMMFILADNHRKNILMKCVSVLSSTATGRIPNRVDRTKQSIIPESESTSGKLKIRYDTHPALPLPSPKAFPK